MMLLNPIWLFALAALSIPVAIHLWNIRPGKTLKVGSIALITESAQKSSRSIKLRDLLLLLLRCLLLALLAIVLAIPFWEKHESSNIKGWVLMPKENFTETYQKFKPSIDSLTKAGYQFHYFDKGFEKADLTKILADKNLKPIKDSISTSSYWSLIQQLDGQVPSSLPVYLFTSNQLKHFTGAKPQVALNLHWQTYTPVDSTSTWIENAWLSNSNDIQVLRGNSKPTAIWFTTYTANPSNNKNIPFGINTDGGKLSVTSKNNKPVEVDTSTWRFAIYSDRNSVDAGYLKAALESIIQFTKHKAVIKEYTDADQISGHQNWIFWLSQKPIKAQIAEKCNNLFAYEQGTGKAVSTSLNDDNEPLSSRKIALYKSISGEFNPAEAPVWTDGYGNSILSKGKNNATNVYHFMNRFDPAWSDLVWSDEFPKMLLKLIVAQPSTQNEKQDRRVMDVKQLLPVIDNEPHSSINKLTERNDLTHYCWLLLVLIFIAERWMAHKKSGKTRVQNG